MRGMSSIPPYSIKLPASSASISRRAGVLAAGIGVCLSQLKTIRVSIMAVYCKCHRGYVLPARILERAGGEPSSCGASGEDGL